MNSTSDRIVAAPGEKIRVFVAESNRMASQLLEATLLRHRQKFEVQAFTSGAAETFQELEKTEPHVAIISSDLQDGSLTGFRVLHELRDSKSKTAPVMLLNSADRDLVIDAFRCGARGILTREHSIESLPECICSVRGGQVWVDSQQIEFLLQLIMRLRPLRVAKPGGLRLLTQREQEVLHLVAEGMRNEEISQKLNLTEHTVRNYLCRIFEKLGVSSRVELVLYALAR
jgi:two-component system, NarL family, nitrate/nitrite response regulator NarL